MGLNLHYFHSSRVFAEEIPLIHAVLHPFNITSLPYWYASCMTLACRDFKTESR